MQLLTVSIRHCHTGYIISTDTYGTLSRTAGKCLVDTVNSCIRRNGSQLYAVKEEVERGLNFDANTGGAKNNKLGSNYKHQYARQPN